MEGVLVDTWDPQYAHLACSAPLPIEGTWRRSSYCALCDDCRWRMQRMGDAGVELLASLAYDHREFYSCRSTMLLLAGLGVAAVPANTSLDQDFQDWYEEDVRNESTDDLAARVDWFGHGWATLPVYVSLSLLAPAFEDHSPTCGVLGDWSGRCVRSFLVGGPPLIALRYLLGASRPIEEIGSHWKPFDDTNSVSGHAFVGALPFLNAARMTDSPCMKVVLYGASTLTAWARVNNQKHYLSQVMLGWWLAWLAVDAVDRTELRKQSFLVLPQPVGDGFGVQAVWRW